MQVLAALAPPLRAAWPPVLDALTAAAIAEPGAEPSSLSALWPGKEQLHVHTLLMCLLQTMHCLLNVLTRKAPIFFCMQT